MTIGPSIFRTCRNAFATVQLVSLVAIPVGCSAAAPPSPSAVFAESATRIPVAIAAPESIAPVAHVDAQPAASPSAPSSGPARYRVGPLYSPLTRSVVDRLKAVLAKSKGRPNVFQKVGDSITISNHFMKCFVEDELNLGAYQDLEPTFRFFNQVYLLKPKTSFDRASMSTRVGWTARDVRHGSPSPLEKEWIGTRPGFAFLMFGTNDATLKGVREFEREMMKNVDWLLNHGVIPLMSTVPPKLKHPESSAAIPDINAIVRVIAQARQLPLMDYHRALQAVPAYGLQDDGVHPKPYVVGFSVAHGCWLTPEGLQWGMNVRNLLGLTTLDRMRRFVVENAEPEPDTAGLAGEGSAQSPWEIDDLPFVDVGRAGHGAASPGPCETNGSATVVYRVDLPAPVRFRARVFGDPGVEVRVSWATEGQDARCLARAETDIEVSAPEGPSRLVVSSRPSTNGNAPGTWRLIVVPVL